MFGSLVLVRGRCPHWWGEMEAIRYLNSRTPGRSSLSFQAMLTSPEVTAYLTSRLFEHEGRQFTDVREEVSIWGSEPPLLSPWLPREGALGNDETYMNLRTGVYFLSEE